MSPPPTETNRFNDTVLYEDARSRQPPMPGTDGWGYALQEIDRSYMQRIPNFTLLQRLRAICDEIHLLHSLDIVLKQHRLLFLLFLNIPPWTPQRYEVKTLTDTEKLPRSDTSSVYFQEYRARHRDFAFLTDISKITEGVDCEWRHEKFKLCPSFILIYVLVKDVA